MMIQSESFLADTEVSLEDGNKKREAKEVKNV